MANSRWKNFWKGIKNNGFYVSKDGKWKAAENLVNNYGSNWSDALGSDAASISGVENLLSSVVNKYTESGLTGAEKEANAFAAQEAERSRDWTEEMYEKYNSLSGKIAQAEQAGVNPMLAVTGQAATPIGSASSSPGSVSPTGHGLTDLLGTIMGLMKVKSEINLMDSEAERNLADAEKTVKEASWIDRLSEAQLNHLVMSKDELESRLGVNSETANKLKAEFSKLVSECARINQITDAEKKALEAQAAYDNWRVENEGTFKSLDLGNDLINTIVNLAVSLIQNNTQQKIARLK